MIAKILPLIRLPAHLDYFDYEVPTRLHTDICIGQIVRIPFRKSTIHGVVIDIQKESSEASLKSIESILVKKPVFTEFQKELLSWFSDFYFVSRATVARMMLLPPLTRKKKEVEIQEEKKESSLSDKKIRLSPASIQALSSVMNRIKEAKNPILFSCTNEHEKIAFYAKCAQNTHQQKKQLLIICPTIPETIFMAKCLAPYLPSDPLCLHGDLRISELRIQLENIQKRNAHIIVGTRMALFHAIPDLTTIVVDQSERMEHKQYDMHPRYHVSTVLYALAKKLSLKVILQSHAPRIEDMVAASQGVLEYISTGTSHTTTPVIHLTQEEYIPHTPLISETLKNKIIKQLSKDKHVFLFLNKKGLGSYVICQTCQTIFSCPICGRHRAYSEKTHQLSCSFCHTENQLPQTCPTCKGNSFLFPGVGSEKITSLLKKLFPEVPVHEMNRNTTQVLSSPTRSPSSRGQTQYPQKNDLLDSRFHGNDILSDKSCIVVGTSFIPLSHPELFSLFGLVCILLADPSPSLSDFRAHEIQWQTLTRILMLSHAEKTESTLQAFEKNNTFISSLSNFDYVSFYTEQLRQRKDFGWPPYTRLITLHYHPQKTRHDQDALKNLTKTLSQVFGKTIQISPLQKRISREHERILITLHSPYIPYEPLPENIRQELKKLPPGWLVDIDAYM